MKRSWNTWLMFLSIVWGLTWHNTTILLLFCKKQKKNGKLHYQVLAAFLTTKIGLKEKGKTVHCLQIDNHNPSQNSVNIFESVTIEIHHSNVEVSLFASVIYNPFNFFLLMKTLFLIRRHWAINNLWVSVQRRLSQ